MAAEVRILYFRFSILCDSLLQRLNTEAGIQRVRESPGQYLAYRPIHDRHQIQQAVLNGDKRNIDVPDLVRTRDRQLLQQVWPDLVLWMLLACVGPFLDRLQPHDAHQAAHAMSPCLEPGLEKIPRNLAAAKERVRRKNLIELVHQIDRRRIKANRLVIYTGASDLDLCSLCGSYHSVQAGSSPRPL